MEKVFTGVVQVGNSYAKSLGFPTINIPLTDSSVSGIYIARVTSEGNVFKAAVFADPERHVLEAHLLDFVGDLYGKEVSIELLQFVRPREHFDTEEALQAAIASDVEKTREFFAQQPLKKFKTGLVIGKFYPPHKGHSYLIEKALERSEHLDVIVRERSVDTISGDQRAEWLATLHPQARVLVARDIIPNGEHEAWARYVRELLGATPEAMFTSESYGPEYARILGSEHVLVDKERGNFPISATMVREHPEKYLEYLSPEVRAYFTGQKH